MPRPKLWQPLPSFEVYPKLTFFGLNKGQSHCISLHKGTTEKYKDFFDLGEGQLQKSIIFIIESKPFPATIRLARINRTRPYKLKPGDLSERQVILFEWKRFDLTQFAIRNNLREAYELIKNNQKNEKYKVKFNHLEDNIFLLRFGITETLERQLAFLSEMRK